MKKRIWNYFAIAPIFAFAMSIAGSNALAGGLLSIEFDSQNFGLPIIIDNPYWPLLPGNSKRIFIYIGETEDGCVFNKVTVDPTEIKTFSDSVGGYEDYNDFKAQVVVDREWEVDDDCETVIYALANDKDYEPEEGIGEWTFDWYRQDINGNIWYMGEYSQSFEDEVFIVDGDEYNCADYDFQAVGVPIECTEGSWESGQWGEEEEIVGEAGIVVPANEPYGFGSGLIKPGTSYQQEVAEGAEDMAKILKTNASLSVEDGVSPGDYDNCRKVKESNPFEPGASVEHKWYCPDGPGHGLVLIQGIGGGPTESEVLVYVQ